MENTSGQGNTAIVPDEIRGWNWGAFFLTFIWGAGNKVYSSFLAFIPYVGVLMPIVLGVKGSAWAWQNKEWESVEHFKQVQRKWAWWGVGVTAIFIAGVITVMLQFGVFQQDAEAEPVAETVENRQPVAQADDAVQQPAPVEQTVVAEPTAPVPPPVISPPVEQKPVEIVPVSLPMQPPQPVSVSVDANAPALSKTVQRHYPHGDLTKCLDHQTNEEIIQCVER